MTFAASAPAVRVLVVDDSRPFRQAVHAVLDATDGFEWIGDATCGETGVEQATRLRPDLVLMDVRMPGIGGVEAARTIASRALPAIVILITGEKLPHIVPDGTVAEILPKERLNPQSLMRLWRQHGASKTRTAEALVQADDDRESADTL